MNWTVCFLSVVGVLAGCQPEFVSVDIRYQSGEDKTLYRPLTITDRETVNQLASYFPGVGTDWWSLRAGGWVAVADMTFRRDDGRIVKVSSDCESWSEDSGDRSVKAGLKEFLDRLYKEHAVAMPAAATTAPAEPDPPGHER